MRGNLARGVALVLVLWLVAALSLVVSASTRGLRQGMQSVQIQLDSLKAELKLDGAIQMLAQYMLASPALSKDYHWYLFELDGERVWIEITPSDGLVDVSVASEELLLTLISGAAGLPEAEAAVLVSRIKDWIDPDDQPHGVGGAEAPQYRAAGWPSMPRNAPPEDPGELRSVLGMSQELYERIRPFLGLNGQQKIQLDSAPPDLIDILSRQKGLGEKVRLVSREQRAALMLSQDAGQFFSPVASSGPRDVRLRAFLESEHSQWWLREIWVALAPRPDTVTPWTTLLIEPLRRSPRPDKEIRP